jgi:hypothetical protein
MSNVHSPTCIAVQAFEDAALQRTISLVNNGGIPGANTRRMAMAALARRSDLSSNEEKASHYLQRG